jgi:cytochrome c553
MQTNHPQRSRALLTGILLCVVCLGAAVAADGPTFEDTLGQRLKACTQCHGDQGRAAPDGYYPRIAGKPAGYLYNQMKHFQRGERRYDLMTKMVDPLSDDYLWEISRFFSALDVPYSPPVPSTASVETMRRGERLAMQGDASRQLPACAACHGAQLTGTTPATPGLLGLPRDYINAQMGAWRTGARRGAQPDCMADIARRMKPEDIASVSTWLSSQPWPANTRTPTQSATTPPLKCGSHAQAQERP